MYDRSPKKQELNLTVSGMLWNRSLVMQDEETKTLWSHLLGRAMEGKLKGTQLETIPSTMTTWKAWRRSHAKSSVLAMSRTARTYTDAYLKQPERFVLGLRSQSSSRAYSLVQLKKTPVINDDFNKEPVVVTFEPASGGGHAFSRKLGDSILSFHDISAIEKGALAGQRMKDKESGSTWNSATGACIEGKWKGRELREITIIPSYLKAWKVFHPRSSFFTPLK